MADNTTQASWEAGDVIATAAVNLRLNATLTYIEAA